MLDTQNQGPQCAACGAPMKLTAIEPSNSSGQELRTFACPYCRRVQQNIIESTVTEVWLEPQRTIKGHHTNAVTHKVRAGCMIPKKAR
jgi:hypothetical protein